VGLTDDATRTAISKLLKREFEDLEATLASSRSAIVQLHLRAAGFHFHLSAFFDSSTAKGYQRDLLNLYWAAKSFLKCALDLEPSTLYTNIDTSSGGGLLSYASNYILQMMIAGGFTLLKLLNSFFASHIDLDEGKALFNQTIWAIRKISTVANDLPSRLAEVLAQLWRGGGEGARRQGHDGGGGGVVDGSLQLKVRCRMSMSLVYDSVWRWREEFQAKGRGNLDCMDAHLSQSPSHRILLTGFVPNTAAVKNPTNPDSSAETLAAHAHSDVVIDSNGHHASSLTPGGPPHTLNGVSLLGNGGGFGGGGRSVTPGPLNTFGESNYEVFDPLNWMLDGFVDWPYSFVGEGTPSGHGVEAGVGP
jgi:hypothetical protein